MTRRYHRRKVVRWEPQGEQGDHKPVHAVLLCGHTRLMHERSRGCFVAEQLECHECPWRAAKQRLADKDPPVVFDRDGLRFEKGCVSGLGDVVAVTETEALILRTLHAQNRPVTRAELLKLVRGNVQSNTVAVHIGNLRKKLKCTFGFPWVVTTWDRRYTLERPR